MRITDLLTHERVLLDLKASDKTRLLHDLARRVTTVEVAAEEIAAALIAREQLGSTGLGHGIALPHARIAGLRAPVGLLARLVRPIAYQAIDDAPVDLVFVLILPEGDADPSGTAALAAVARSLRGEEALGRLRRCRTVAEVMGALEEKR